MPTSDRVTVPIVLSRDPATGAYEAKCVGLTAYVGRGSTEVEAMQRLKERVREVLFDRKEREAPMVDEARIIFVEIAVGDGE